ncbi:hypothetical protein BGW38_010463 [Lunasporangiospora selenospora]|uniref:Uncharacterized protein n=1 Tax=Lunasporangiospora selenospora TaxID=979761 RepID=A0A9P6FWN5_9FUNG|nr:hypothetical protein BGW38_010463 [Lunasporangiospora selenospora]
MIQGTIIPLVSNVLGNSTIAGLMAVYSLTLQSISSATAAIVNHQDNLKHGAFRQQAHADFLKEQHQYAGGVGAEEMYNYYEQQQQHFFFGSLPFLSTILSAVGTAMQTINSAWESITSSGGSGSSTPLTTYIIMALLSYIAFRIIYSIVMGVIRSVINLVKMTFMISALVTILWIILQLTSPNGVFNGDSNTTHGSGGSRHRRDPMSHAFEQFQAKFRAEYQRQQQHLQNTHAV